ncbi:pyruvate kinase [Ilumatobacter nonamiensis]|uniref:pyruvate kinase n=1 Tax=Ilumatobacter nonamiensis TaxID=467093 RepID=UPI000347EA9A|nr:pyruvate kinase [Ilumatobacter nonamiensis]
MTRRTKIVATIGPASDSPEMLEQLIEAGIDVVRLNLSHGDVEDHLVKLARVRDAADAVGREVAVLADLPGPKIRSGLFPDGGVMLEGGSLVNLVPGDGPSDATTIQVQHDDLIEALEPGARVQLGDGALSMTVVAVGPAAVSARIDTGGRANGQPGVHLSSTVARLETPTADDLVLAETMAEAGVEFIAVSFVCGSDDIDRVRAVVGKRAQLVSKIETRAALDDLEDIIAASDAVMVARGDLGLDCPIEDVPHLQKRIVRDCVAAAKPVITATQMLESMITAPSPTRAEVSDVANAVFDGTDAVMLSGETAIGRDPVGVVRTMATVASRAESEASYRQWAEKLRRLQRDFDGTIPVEERITMALSHAASEAAVDADVAAILCCTRSGRTARAMARFRPAARMIGLSPDPKMVRTMCLSWGVEPIAVDMYSSTDEMVWFAVETALESEAIDHGDTVVVLAGAPSGPGADPHRGQRSVATDVLRLVRVD